MTGNNDSAFGDVFAGNNDPEKKKGGSNRVIEFVKEHKLAVGAGALVLVVLLVILFMWVADVGLFGGESTTATTSEPYTYMNPQNLNGLDTAPGGVSRAKGFIASVNRTSAEVLGLNNKPKQSYTPNSGILDKKANPPTRINANSVGKYVQP
jgi:hypothetical protein